MKNSLREISRVRQVPGESCRRWFSSDTLDLVVWLADGNDNASAAGTVLGFQLCYDKLHAEHALTWRAEGCQLAHKAGDFLLAADQLPPAIRELVSRELAAAAIRDDVPAASGGDRQCAR